MKKLLTIAMVGVASASLGWSQAVVNFANGATGVNAPVGDTNATPVKLAGTTFAADLFYGTVSTSAPNSLSLSQLTDAGVAQTFQTGAAAGYWNSLALPTLPVSGDMEFIVVVWQTSAGASWAAATGGGAGSQSTYVGHGGTEWGFSAPITFTPNTFPSPNSNLQGLTSFNLVPVPEPTTLALGGLGAAALLLFRRRK